MTFDADSPRWLRFLDWLEAHTTGEHTWPWAQSWGTHHWRFHFASGVFGFFVAAPLPRWLPGFVKSGQMPEIGRWPDRLDTDLTLIVPLFPPGRWHAMRTRRTRRRR